MAQAQGICKNCGSLILLNDKEEMCECLFCDCVFPTSEALEIAKNPSEYTFPNEEQPKRDGVKKYNVTPVYPDPIPNAVKRAKAEQITKEEKPKKNLYEVSPNDIKAPKKVILTIVAIAVSLIVVCAAISLPMYFSRESHKETIVSSIDAVMTEFTVDTSLVDGYGVGYSISGIKNTKLSLATEDEISAEQIVTTFMNYAALRAEAYEISEDDFSQYYGSIMLTVYSPSGGYILQVDDESELDASSVEDLD